MKKSMTFRFPKFVITLLSFTFFFGGCQKTEIFQNRDPELREEFLYVDNLKKKDISSQEARIIKEASNRMSRYIVIEGDKISINKTAEDLNIDQRLFDLWYSAIDIYNEGKYNIKLPERKLTTKGGEEAPTGTRGGNIICDIAASTVSGYLATGGFGTTKKYFDMWYFDNRSTPYTMNPSEWRAVSDYVRKNLPVNFRNNPFRYENGRVLQCSDFVL